MRSGAAGPPPPTQFRACRRAGGPPLPAAATSTSARLSAYPNTAGSGPTQRLPATSLSSSPRTCYRIGPSRLRATIGPHSSQSTYQRASSCAWTNRWLICLLSSQRLPPRSKARSSAKRMCAAGSCAPEQAYSSISALRSCARVRWCSAPARATPRCCPRSAWRARPCSYDRCIRSASNFRSRTTYSDTACQGSAARSRPSPSRRTASPLQQCRLLTARPSAGSISAVPLQAAASNARGPWKIAAPYPR